MVLIKVFLLDCFIVVELFFVLAKAATIPIIKVAPTCPITTFSDKYISIHFINNKKIIITLNIFSIFFQRMLFIFIQFIFYLII